MAWCDSLSCMHNRDVDVEGGDVTQCLSRTSKAVFEVVSSYMWWCIITSRTMFLGIGDVTRLHDIRYDDSFMSSCVKHERCRHTQRQHFGHKELKKCICRHLCTC